MKNIRMLLLIGMTIFTIAMIGLVGWMIFSEDGLLNSAINPFSNNSDNIRIFVQVPTSIEIGEEFKLVVTVQNIRGEYVNVEEIRLPQELLEVAVVSNIFPGTTNQTTFDKLSTGFEIDFMIAPGDQREFVIVLQPWQENDISGEVEVITDTGTGKSGFRTLIREAVVVIPTFTPTTTATSIPTLTPTFPAPTPTQVEIPYKSVVKVTAKVKHSSYLKPVWSGSGTIVSPDGLVLTNAHLVSPSETFQADAYLISISDTPDRPPVEMYYAEPVQVDRDLDLAILRIMLDINQRPVDWDELNLPAVPLGDAETLELGDTLTIIGYPVIGGETVTLTRGDVSGFTAEYKYGDRAFIKTSATIAAGTSGGLAMDENGYLVAIPTQLGSGSGDNLVDCRVLADTNGDGDIDQRDTCIPVGGFFNALRPINLALSLIDASQLDSE